MMDRGLGWRWPIAISIAVHGALAASMLLMPSPVPRSDAASEPVRIEIVSVEAPPPELETPEAIAPEAPEAPEIVPKPERQDKEKRRRRPVRVEPPSSPPAEGGDGTPPAEGGGGAVAPGGIGKTKDGRDLGSLDLSPHVSVPAYEDQGPGVVIPAPPKDPKKHATKDGGYNYDDTAFGAHVARDGTVTFDGRGNSEVNGIPRIGLAPGRENESPSIAGTWAIDLNDWILSAAGDDPYSYEKRKFLEATREERLVMARAACGERLSSSLVELPQRLDKIWKSRRSVAEKRAILFDLWDDCAEDGPKEVLRYGELARLTILDFIQKHLPEGSEEAYTELEIDRMNRRRASSRRFAPYGGRL